LLTLTSCAYVISRVVRVLSFNLQAHQAILLLKLLILCLLFVLGNVKLTELSTQLVKVTRKSLMVSPLEVFELSDRNHLLLLLMKECANVELIAPGPVTRNSLVFVWMVKPFHSGVTLVTHQSLLALVPSNSLNQGRAIFGKVVDHVWQPSEIPGVMGINAALGIVRILLSGAPAGFVVKHLKGVGFQLLFKDVKVLVEQGVVLEHARNEVVFDTYIKGN